MQEQRSISPLIRLQKISMHPFIPKLWGKLKIAFGVASDVVTLVAEALASMPVVSAMGGIVGGILGNVAGELLSSLPESLIEASREKRKRTKEGVKIYETLANGEMFSEENNPFVSEEQKILFFAQVQLVFEQCEKAYTEEQKKRKKKKKKPAENGAESVEVPDIVLAGSDGKAIVSLFTDYMYKENIEAYLKLSNFYVTSMSEEDKALLLEMLNGAREGFLRRCYANELGHDDQILLSLFKQVMQTENDERFAELEKFIEAKFASFATANAGLDEDTLASLFEGALEKALAQRIAHMGADSSGELNLTEISAGAFAPRYLARKCPECSYSGEHIYFNEGSNEFHCAACGLTYSVMKGIENEAKILGTLDTVRSTVERGFGEMTERLERIDARETEIAESTSEIHEMTTWLVEEAVTKEFLLACMNAHTEKIDASIGEYMRGAFANLDINFGEMGDNLVTAVTSSSDHVIDVIGGECLKLREQNNAIFDKLDTLSRQMTQMYGQIVAMGQNARDYKDEIIGVMQKRFEELLYRLEAIESRSEMYASPTPVCFSQEHMMRIVDDSVQALDRNEPEAVKSAFGAVISSINKEIEELTKGLLSKLPNEIRIDGGDTTKQFACPFCGVVAKRAPLSRKPDHAHCDSCGNTYFRINPEQMHGDRPLKALTPEDWARFGFKRGDALTLAKMADTVAEWKKTHTLKLFRNPTKPSEYALCPTKFTDLEATSFIISLDDCFVIDKTRPGNIAWKKISCNIGAISKILHFNKITNQFSESFGFEPFGENITYIFSSCACSSTVNLEECSFLRVSRRNQCHVYMSGKKLF